MMDGSLNSFQQGIYYTYGSIPEYTDLSQGVFQDFLRMNISKNQTSADSKEVSPVFSESDRTLLKSCLVVFHEREHFIQYHSTIFGLLMWRIFQCIKSNTGRIFYQLGLTELTEKIYFPIHKWAKENGEKYMRENPPVFSKEYQLAKDNGLEQLAIENQVSILSKCIDEIYTYLDFYSFLMSRQDISVAESLKLTNKANALLSRRSGLKNTIAVTSKYDSDRKINSIVQFSTEEILEAGARFAELYVMMQYDCSDSEITQWEEKLKTDKCKPVYFYLLETFGRDPILCKGIIDLSLSTPIDLICSSMFEEEIELFDLLPGSCLQRLTESTISLLNENKGEINLINALREDICRKANLFLPREIYEIASTRQLEINANWFGLIEEIQRGELQENIGRKFQNEEIDNYKYGNSYSYYETIKTTFQLLFSSRTQRPDLFCYPSASKIQMYPDLEWFTDFCAFNPPSYYMRIFVNENYHPDYFSSFISFLEHQLLLFTLGFGTITEIIKFEEKFIERTTVGDYSAHGRVTIEKDEMSFITLIKGLFPSKIWSLFSQSN